MPSLSLAPTALSPAPPPPRRCRVFVSYAHQDAMKPEGRPFAHSLLDRFEIELKNLRRTLAARGLLLHADEVFIDRQRLNTAPAWRAEIGQALAECEVLLFLVSPDSRASDFCVQEEVGRVARRDGAIVPLLLRETADWKTLDLGGGKLLGECHSGGLPKNEIGNALAITQGQWGDPDVAWAAATEALTGFLARQLFGWTLDSPAPEGGASARHAAPTVPLPVELPVAYFCDQLHVTGGFDDGFDEHRSRHPAGRPHAVLAIVQGEYDDQPDRLVDRLHHHHLAARLKAVNVPHAPRRVPMSWPPGGEVDRPFASRSFAGRSVLKHLCEVIDTRLAMELVRCRKVDDAATVIDAHFGQPDVQPVAVLAFLPNRDSETAASLKHLVRCLDLCANLDGQMAKLALYCVDEQAGATAHWAGQVPRAKRLALLALRPLRPFNEEELRQWHIKYGLEALWPWPDCLALFRRTVADLGAARAELRLRHWAEAVQRHRPDVGRLMPKPHTPAT